MGCKAGLLHFVRNDETGPFRLVCEKVLRSYFFKRSCILSAVSFKAGVEIGFARPNSR